MYDAERRASLRPREGEVYVLTVCAPLSLRSVVPCLSVISVLACILLGPSAAQAGIWTLKLTSSSHSQTLNGVTTPGTYPPQKGTPSSSISLPIFSAPAPVSITPGYTAQVQASLSVTVTGTWTANPALASDPVPSTIVLVGTQASAGGAGQPLVQKADDGYGDPSGVASSSGTHYQVVTTSPFTISVSGTASVTATATATIEEQADAIVGGITISTYPVVVSLVGTYNPLAGDNRALTGQQITATQGVTYPVPSGINVTGYTWSFSANNAIKNWDPNAPGDGAPTQIIPLLPTDYTGYPPIGSRTVTVNPISFYDEFAETTTVSCAVTLSFPDYSIQTVNAVSPQITFIKPTVAWSVATGYVQRVIDSSTGSQGCQLLPVPGLVQLGGEAWNNVAVTVLPPFYGGQGCFAQLVTPNTTVTNKTPALSPVFPNNGQEGLDNSFPYRLYVWPVSNDVSKLGGNADSPGFVFGGYNSPADQGFTSAGESDSFGTWVMYKPPAVGSQGTIWVPLQTYGWSWSFTSQWDGSQWNLFRASPASVADDPHYMPTGVMNIPPQWSMIQNNSK